MLGVQEERCHMSLRGERHVRLLSLAQALLFLFVALIFCSLPSPNIPCRFRGSKTSKGRKSLILLHIFTFGDMSISNVVLTLHVIPVLVLLWFLLFAPVSRCICVI